MSKITEIFESYPGVGSPGMGSAMVLRRGDHRGVRKKRRGRSEPDEKK